MKNEVVSREDECDLIRNKNMTAAIGHAAVGHVQSTRGTQYSPRSASPEPGGEIHPRLDTDAFPTEIEPKYAPAQVMGPPPNYYQHPPHHSDIYSLPYAVQYNAQQAGFHNATSAHQPGQHTHPDQHFYYHPPAQPAGQFFYGSWPGANEAPNQNNFYYNPTPLHTMMPPDAMQRRGSASGRGKSSKKSKDYQRQPSYGSLELNVYDVENEHLLNALNFLRSNPKATLFDIDGKL
jgi:hypothetical protein